MGAVRIRRALLFLVAAGLLISILTEAAAASFIFAFFDRVFAVASEYQALFSFSES